MQKYYKLLVYSVVFVCFTLVSTMYFDTDFPWRVRYSMDVLSHGIPAHDLYSFTMPSFPFVDHSLLVSLIFTFIYTFGYGAVSIGVSIIGTYAIAKMCGKDVWLIPLVSAIYLPSFQVRDHVFSFLFFVLLISNREKLFQSQGLKKLILPVFMLLWANFHGGFSLGIMYIWGYIFVDILLAKWRTTSLRFKIDSILLGVFSTLSTLATPYGIGTWHEVFRTLLNSNLKKYVVEWRSIFRLPDPYLLSIVLFIFIVFFGLFIISVKYSKKIRWHELFTFFLFVQGIFSVRFVVLFAVSSIPTIQMALDRFIKTNKKRLIPERLQILITTGTILFLCLLILETIVALRAQTIANNVLYPVEATEYLLQNKPEGHIFSFPHWNTYFLWKMPDMQIFMDGRMFVWSQEPKNNELTSAFESYLGITAGHIEYSPIFDQFCISTVVWGTQNMNSFWYDDKGTQKFTNELIKDGWKISFENNYSRIYTRPLPNGCENK